VSIWVGKYRSPKRFPQLLEADRLVYTDESLLATVVMMVLGPHWEVAGSADGWILMRQRPPHDEWEWEFTRQLD
jgi:hypothetical protein